MVERMPVDRVDTGQHVHLLPSIGEAGGLIGQILHVDLLTGKLNIVLRLLGGDLLGGLHNGLSSVRTGFDGFLDRGGGGLLCLAYDGLCGIRHDGGGVADHISGLFRGLLHALKDLFAGFLCHNAGSFPLPM